MAKGHPLKQENADHKEKQGSLWSRACKVQIRS